MRVLPLHEGCGGERERNRERRKEGRTEGRKDERRRVRGSVPEEGGRGVGSQALTKRAASACRDGEGRMHAHVPCAHCIPPST